MKAAARMSALLCAPLLASSEPASAASPPLVPTVRNMLRQGADKSPMAITLAHRQAPEDPIVTLRQRYVELMTPRSADGVEDEEADAAEALRKESTRQEATTLAGALASLEWARKEFAGHYVEGRGEADQMDVWTLAMIDNALGVLRRETARQVA